jgi:hypothetical protein
MAQLRPLSLIENGFVNKHDPCLTVDATTMITRDHRSKVNFGRSASVPFVPKNGGQWGTRRHSTQSVFLVSTKVHDNPITSNGKIFLGPPTSSYTCKFNPASSR